jgi:hypothetical protein
MKRNINPIIIGIIFLSACNFLTKENLSIQEINKNDNIIHINLDEGDGRQFLYTSSLFQKVNPIILEATNESLIGFVNKMAIYNDFLLILDSKISKGLFVFKKDGTFVKRIGSIGEGPGEYIGISDFTIDHTNNLVYVLDAQMRRINKYKLPDGKFIESVNIQNENIRSHYIQYFNGKLYGDANSYIENPGNEYLLHEIDINTGETIAKWLNSEEYDKGYNCRLGNNIFYVTENPFYDSYYGGKPKFVHRFMDMIIEIDKEGMTPILSTESSQWVSKETIFSLRKEKSVENQMIKLMQSNQIYNISNYIEGRNFILFNYNHGFAQKTIFYDQQNRSTQKFSVVFDDLTFNIDLEKQEVGIIPVFLYSDQQGLYSCISPDQMTKFVEIIQSGKLKLNAQQKENLATLKEDANPVILYFLYE